MPIGDVMSDERGTGARYNDGKPEFSQIPMFALEGVAKVLMYGAKKYAPGNWAKGMSWRIVYDCAMRHMTAWQAGEENDNESGLPHLDHALTNLIFLSAYRRLYPEGDDRIRQFYQGEVAERPLDGPCAHSVVTRRRGGPPRCVACGAEISERRVERVQVNEVTPPCDVEPAA